MTFAPALDSPFISSLTQTTAGSGNKSDFALPVMSKNCMEVFSVMGNFLAA